MRSVRALLSAAVTFALAGTALAAQDATLYDPAPPPGAGFVRMVNLLDHPDELPTRLGTKDLGPVAHRAVSPYVPVMGGAGKVTLASGEEQPIAVEAGGYYTVVGKGTAGQPAITVISDPVHTHLARSMIILYNLSSAPAVDLRTLDGAQAVVAEVTPGTQQSRVVNPIEVDLGVFVGGELVQGFEGLELGQGRVYSMIVSDQGEGTQARWVPSTTSTK